MTTFPESLQGCGEILRLCEVIQIPPLLRHFVAKNSFIPGRYNWQKRYFVPGMKEAVVLAQEDVKIAKLDQSFETGFLEKIEAPEKCNPIKSFEILRSLSVQEIIAACGNGIYPMPLHTVFWLMSQQPNSVEPGHLHSMDQDNIFLCCNVHEVPEVVLLRTGIGGWEIRSEPCSQRRSYWGRLFLNFDTK